MANPGRARRTFVSIAIGCLVAAGVCAQGTAVRPEQAILVSRQLAREAGVGVGDLVTVAARADGAGAAQFRVAGFSEPMPDPRKFSAQRFEARLHLSDL